jgi:hypothetical protein
MNILVMAHLAPPRHCAGAEMMLLSMLRPLSERGHRVDWLLSRESADRAPYDLHGVTVYPRVHEGDPLRFLDQADVVIAHLENMPRAVILSRLRGIPFVLVMHNDHEISRAWGVEDAAAIVTNSDWMHAAFGSPANGLVVRPPVFAKDYQTTPGAKVTLVNLNENKGGYLFAELVRRMPDVEFLAVEGAYAEQIIPEGPNVEVRAHATDMRAVYGDTRIALMPSLYESWGRVGVEAMCSGIPVIAHPTPGLVESLGTAGTFVDRDDVKAWETAIRRLLKRNAWREASRAALARAAELDPTEDIATWCDAIETIGRNGRRHAA